MAATYELSPEHATAVVCAALELLASVEEHDQAMLDNGVLVSAAVMRHLVDSVLLESA